MQHSPDGEWLWNGTRWNPVYSPDRAWRWDGFQWIPTGPPPAQRWRYEPTEWTRRLQVILIALLVVGGLVGVALVPAFLVPTTQRTLDAMVATMAQDPNVDIQSFRSTMDAIVTASLALGGVVGVVAVVVIITGIVRLWRWVYWYLAVSFLLAPLGVLENAALYAMGSGPISIPGWLLLYSVPVALVETALSVWMIVLYRRHGTWARRRLPA